jgi:spore coat protein U-like protein
MKRSKTIALAVVAALLLMAGSAWAGTAASVVPVTAYVGGMCIVTGGAIDFGNIEVINQAGVVTQPTINCTLGLPYAITSDDGLNSAGPGLPNLVDGALNLIPYTITIVDPAGGVGTGGINNMGLGASITGDHTLDPAGAYNDTLTLTVAW